MKRQTLFSVLIIIVISAAVSIASSLITLRYYQKQSENSKTYYVFDLQRTVNTIKNFPDFEKKLSVVEQTLNSYSSPVFLKGAIVNVRNPHIKDITDEVLARAVSHK